MHMFPFYSRMLLDAAGVLDIKYLWGMNDPDPLDRRCAGVGWEIGNCWRGLGVS
jgi:hypothetical protein